MTDELLEVDFELFLELGQLRGLGLVWAEIRIAVRNCFQKNIFQTVSFLKGKTQVTIPTASRNWYAYHIPWLGLSLTSAKERGGVLRCIRLHAAPASPAARLT